MATLTAVWFAAMVALAKCSATSCHIPTPSVFLELLNKGIPGIVMGTIMLVVFPLSVIFALAVIPAWKDYRGLLNVGMEPVTIVPKFFGTLAVHLAVYIVAILLFMRADAARFYRLPILLGDSTDNIIIITTIVALVGIVPMMIVGRIVSGAVELLSGITYILSNKITERMKS